MAKSRTTSASSAKVSEPAFTYGRLEIDRAPQIGHIMGYRGIWVLAQLSADGKRLRGTHYTYCAMMGRRPLWRLYNITGKFLRVYWGKNDVAEAFPNHTWRRVPARWTFEELAPDESLDRQREILDKWSEL
jgi:hypothetical protein